MHYGKKLDDGESLTVGFNSGAHRPCLSLKNLAACFVRYDAAIADCDYDKSIFLIHVYLQATLFEFFQFFVGVVKQFWTIST
jgi:hypothetical protein